MHAMHARTTDPINGESVEQFDVYFLSHCQRFLRVRAGVPHPPQVEPVRGRLVVFSSGTENLHLVRQVHPFEVANKFPSAKVIISMINCNLCSV